MRQVVSDVSVDRQQLPGGQPGADHRDQLNRLARDVLTAARFEPGGELTREEMQPGLFVAQLEVARPRDAS